MVDKISQQVDIETALETVLQRKGVLGYIVFNAEGTLLKTSFEEDVAKTYARLLPDLSYLGHNMVRDLDPEDNLQFLRIRSQAREFIISTRPTYTLAVVQNVSASG